MLQTKSWVSRGILCTAKLTTSASRSTKQTRCDLQQDICVEAQAWLSRSKLKHTLDLCGQPGMRSADVVPAHWQMMNSPMKSAANAALCPRSIAVPSGWQILASSNAMREVLCLRVHELLIGLRLGWGHVVQAHVTSCSMHRCVRMHVDRLRSGSSSACCCRGSGCHHMH
jgi:hypothetical protein